MHVFVTIAFFKQWWHCISIPHQKNIPIDPPIWYRIVPRSNNHLRFYNPSLRRNSIKIILLHSIHRWSNSSLQSQHLPKNYVNQRFDNCILFIDTIKPCYSKRSYDSIYLIGETLIHLFIPSLHSNNNEIFLWLEYIYKNKCISSN